MSEDTIEARNRYIVEEMALVQKVEIKDVFQWIGKGWSDTKNTSGVSLSYAALFILVGVCISFGFYFLDLPYLILPSLSGFLLVGPALAIGFYEGSLRIQKGENFHLMDAIFAYRRNTLSIMGIGIAQVFLFMIWVRFSFTLFAISFPGVSPEWGTILERAISLEGLHFGFIIMILGAVFASIIFLTAAFSLPLMIDRKTVLIPAMITSAYAVQQNFKAMLVWAGIISLIMFLGTITGIGLIVAFPVAGHATWHAYQQVMGKS